MIQWGSKGDSTVTFTSDNLQELIHLLEEQPQARRQLRSLLINGDFQAVPERLDRLTEVVGQLAEAQQETGVRIAQLTEAQQRTEVRMEQLAEAQQRTEARVDTLGLRMEQLAEAQQRTEARMDTLGLRMEQLAEAQQRTEARVDTLGLRMEQLAEAQQQTAESLNELTEQVQKLTAATDEFREWQHGEAGQRAGERYEQRILQRAPALLSKGQGGSSNEPEVRQHLLDLLESPLVADVITDEADPFLADLIWWKGDQYAVAEVSIEVDSGDVMRAARRADTLRRAGVQAVGVVIGEDWTSPAARQQAEAYSVLWKVGNDLSEGFIGFRRLAA